MKHVVTLPLHGLSLWSYRLTKKETYLDSVVGENLWSAGGEHLKPVVGDSDGQGLDPDTSAVVLDDHLLAVDPAAQDPLAAVQEVDAVVLDVEADQIAAYKFSRNEVSYGCRGELAENSTHKDVSMGSNHGQCKVVMVLSLYLTGGHFLVIAN